MEVKEKDKGSLATENDIYNTEIYSHIMCPLSVDQISLEDLFFYELLPVPKPMFTVTTERRFPKK